QIERTHWAWRVADIGGVARHRLRCASSQGNGWNHASGSKMARGPGAGSAALRMMVWYGGGHPPEKGPGDPGPPPRGGRRGLSPASGYRPAAGNSWTVRTSADLYCRKTLEKWNW